MRKLIILAASLMALAVPAAGMAAVSYDATHEGVITGYVGKGDVQSTLQWNDAKVQSTPVKFTTTFKTFTDQSWTCNNGETRHNVKTLTFKQGLKSEVVRKSNGKIDGWNLIGLDGLTYLGTTITGPAWLDCADAGGNNWAGSMNTAQDHAIGDELLVNDVLLPETPVVAPTV